MFLVPNGCKKQAAKTVNGYAQGHDTLKAFEDDKYWFANGDKHFTTTLTKPSGQQ